MCGRYGFVPGKDIYKRFKIDKYTGKLKPSYNVAPGRIMPVIIRKSPNQMVEMKWGLIPHWAQDPKIGYRMINARAETLGSRPAFRSLLHSKRCLVPAIGFYEWAHQGKEKIPYYIRLLNEEMFSFAGLYDTWNDKEGREISSYTIITTDSNELVSKIHERMPVILDREGEDRWLDKEGRIDKLMGLLKSYPADEMQAYRISTMVNSPKNDSEELIEQIK